MSKDINVLLLDGDTVQVLAIARSLKKNHYKVSAFCENKLSFGWSSRFIDNKVLCPNIMKETEKYLDFLENYLSKNKYDVLIPLFDDTAEIMSKNKQRFQKYVNVAIPDFEVFIYAHDKNKTLEIAKKIGIPHPKTICLQKNSLEIAANYCGFPSLIKPNVGAGARGIVQVNTLEELQQVYPKHLEEFGPSTLQQFIEQTDYQYKCQIYRDKNGVVKATTVQKKYRYFPITGGSTSCSEIVDVPEIVDYSKKILNEINWIGFADFDYICDPTDKQYKIIEINPRIPASIRSSINSNVDYAELIVRDAMGEKTDKYNSTTGIILRYMSLEVLWFLFSSNKERFHSYPNWFKFFGKNICYVDGTWDDPFTMLTGFFLGVKKYINPSFRKSKLSFDKGTK